jgi:putative iron-dependent peroxidase
MPHTQAIEAPLTSNATFIVLTIAPGRETNVRSVLAGIGGLAKSVAFRDPTAALSVTVGIGARAWDAVTGLPRPAELKPFEDIRGATHSAPATPGDIVLHLRAERRDMTFEFEKHLLEQLGDAATVVDEVEGFRYFDARDLLGFVDGTANPVGPAVPDAVLVAHADDAHCAGGAYLVIQKYLHDMKGWNNLPVETQEKIIGRTKLDNIELPDQPEADQKPHKQLSTIVDEDGNECDILRDNMPFGSPGKGEFGTFFIGYSRRLWVIEEMLKRMFIGVPEGKHDRILDYSRAVTGCTFFVPSAAMLESIDDNN